jgi:hypothetical protein
MPPQVLDDQKRVLGDRTHPRVAPVAQALLSALWVVGDAFIDAKMQSDSSGHGFRGLRLIGAITVERSLLAMEQLRHHARVVHAGSRGFNRVHEPRTDITAGMHLHAEIPLAGLLRLMHLRVTPILLVLRR